MRAKKEAHDVLRERPRVMFIYWGRRGLSQFALEVARAALANPDIEINLSVSRQNESFAAFEEFGEVVVPINTFFRNVGALGQVWRIPIIQRRLRQYISTKRPVAVIELMPHVWSSFIAPAIKNAGVRYVTIVHDANPHPGDYRSASTDWLMRRTLRQADVILTLSRTVARQIQASGRVLHNKIHPLFHPDLDFGGRHVLQLPRTGEPMRLLFFGRIMPYKGLPLFLDMVDLLRKEGISVNVGVFGEGALGESAARLTAMGAEVINRWMTEAEIRDLLPDFHAVVLSHVEASQSGVAAAAMGAGLPVIATPVGGIIEQVEDGITGVLAERVDARALAQAVKQLLLDPGRYELICHNLAAVRASRSVATFVSACVTHALDRGPAVVK